MAVKEDALEQVTAEKEVLTEELVTANSDLEEKKEAIVQLDTEKKQLILDLADEKDQVNQLESEK